MKRFAQSLLVVAMCLRERRRREHARKTAAARQAAVGVARADGSHEACEVSDEEERTWRRDFQDRYPNLGEEVER